MVAGMFRILAAAATPWAWLPEEKATTPPPRASLGIDDILLKAPRNLNEPVRCSISGFRKILVPARSLSAGDDSNGVRTAKLASTCAAASISVAATDEIGDKSVMRDLYRVIRHTGKTLEPDQATNRGCCPVKVTASSIGSTVRISVILSTKARADASQECLAANSRQACGEIVIADRHAARKSSFNAPTGAAPITSRGPVTGNAATGRPLASASRRTRPKVSVLLGNTKTSAAAEIFASSSPRREPGNTAFGYFRASMARAGPSPTITSVPGRSRSRNA